MSAIKHAGPSVIFRFAVAIRVDIDTGAGETIADTTSPENQRAIEQALYRDLQRLGYDHRPDCELLEYEVIGAETNPRDRDADDGLTYADPRDERDERRSH